MASNDTAAAPAPPEPAPEQPEATMLVSEFPPPPFYYRQASKLTPPPIPQQALAASSRRAAAMAAKAQAESERLRLQGEEAHVLGVAANDDDDDDANVVAVFGEIVEDPLLFEPLDRCDDPRIVRDELVKLNRTVLKGFIKLVDDLVHRPSENKKTRDDLSHNIFLMLKETNKFREHQARETLINLMERQLQERRDLVDELERYTAQAAEVLQDDSETNTDHRDIITAALGNTTNDIEDTEMEVE